MEIFKVKIEHLKTKQEKEIVIEVDEAEESELIVFHTIFEKQEIISSDVIYFSAFQKFRDTLLEMQYGMKCAGAMINAVQSPMMSICEKIYLVKINEPAKMKDALSMFTYFEPYTYVDTKAQMEYFVEWCESLMKQ